MMAMILSLAACAKQPVECSASSASEPVIGIVKEQLERQIARKLRSGEGGSTLSLAKIRAAVAELVISLGDIRTVKEDPNSTKRFCTATFNIRLTTDALSDADDARQSIDLSTVSDLADRADIKRSADTFSSSIDFSVQPTDDGSKVFAEIESDNGMFDFGAEVLSASLMNATIADRQRAQCLAADRQAAEQSAAAQQQKDANLEATRVENQIATQTINAIWKSIATDTRAQMLPLQRAWIRKEEADCRVEAAAVSMDESAVEIARLACDTRMTNERINYLQSYRTAEPASETSDADPAT